MVLQLMIHVLTCCVFVPIETSGINVMVLYPEEGISDIQKLQMTSAPGKNVSVIGMYVSVESDDFSQEL